MATCRAAVMKAHEKPLEIWDVNISDLDPGSVLVKMVASTLCGTDVRRWHGPLPKKDTLTIITGHEPCSVVQLVSGVKNDILGNPIRKVDMVIWSYVACGSCYYCSIAVQPCICRGRDSWGHNRCDQHPYLLGSVSE